jgi:hypothetical protein
MATFRIEYDFPGFQDITAFIGFDPRIIRGWFLFLYQSSLV